MLFNSYEFICVFLPIALLGFFTVGKIGHYRWAIAFLVAASLFFYGWWNPPYLLLILGSILFNYCLGSLLSKDSVSSTLKRKGLLIFGMAVNLGSIGYFKYANFFADTVNAIANANIDLGDIFLPLGISFFTFQQISYLVDAYNGETKEYNFLRYCLFVSFFPQLIAGPIVLHKEVLPQFAQKAIYHFNRENLSVGITIFSIGLFKKVIFADTVALYATPVFDAAANGATLSFFEAWCGALAYTMQLYFDFSGYSDMAIGAARMFGIKLPLNFNSPYKAVNISEFWRRWHMTLSRFLRDYLYIPLGGNRQGKIRRYVNLMITMLLGGLWHGAGWNFVLWGGLHGSYLVIHQQWLQFRKLLGQDIKAKGSWWSRVLGCVLTFFVVVVAWVFFRATSMEAAGAMLTAMFGGNGISLPGFTEKFLGFLPSAIVQFNGILAGSKTALPSPLAMFWIVLLLAIAWGAPNTQQWMERANPALDYPAEFPSGRLGNVWWEKLQWKPTPQWSVVVGLAAGLSLVFLLRPTEFLYFQF
ncbi:MBOAT family O-acyltransferase [Phormidium sp. CCY1219]|uniref:MBOAT family O-acyltransferase n=1 Tax=Phormidium sp. CCY1219 TaxID=2886104 RepID=UPI002D1F7FD7|nr:MBOAT family protein [Phormidium sp. CCY1219]MEB3827620.1 MBOAT family protein [Phormidium sp. CCY1219]